jgi:hypothetical protein
MLNQPARTTDTDPMEKQSMNEAANPYREFSDITKPEAPPKGNANEVDLIAATSAMRVWSMKTRHTLSAVLRDGFFDGMVDLRFRRDDRIELIASCYADRSQHGLLVVDEADKHGKAKVSLLHRYERSQ